MNKQMTVVRAVRQNGRLQQAIRWLSAFCLLALLAQASIAADLLKPGGTLPAMTLDNQHGKAITLQADTTSLLFAVEKAPSDLVNQFLMKQQANFLSEKKAYFIADISGMPAMITRLFAIPKMQKRPYDILLANKQSSLSFMPRQKEQVTVIKLAAGKVSAIHFVNNAEQLAELF